MTIEEKRNEIERICFAIQHHRKLELSKFVQKYAVARIEGSFIGGSHDDKMTFWMMSSSNLENALNDENEGTLVSKNSALGELFIKNKSGIHNFPSESGSNYNIEILNRALWVNEGQILLKNDVAEIMFNINNGDTFMFDRLSDFLNRLESLRNKQKAQEKEEIRRNENREIIRVDIEARAKNLKRLIDHLPENYAPRGKEINVNSLQNAISDKLRENNIIEGQRNSFTRSKQELRIQNILDPSQEDAKRSHFYDNIPFVIEGGPGTGKTTTMIQRVKFLLDTEAHKYKRALSGKQIEKLLDTETVDKNWLFIAPTNQLLNYLKSNMINEGLLASENNSITINKLRNDLFSAYKLRSTKPSCPLMTIEEEDEEFEETMIYKPERVISSFEDFVVKKVLLQINATNNLDTTLFKNRNRILKIKSIVSNSNRIHTLDALIAFLANLKKEAGSFLVDAKEHTQNAISNLANTIYKNVKVSANNEKDEVVNLLKSNYYIDEQLDDDVIYEQFQKEIITNISTLLHTYIK